MTVGDLLWVVSARPITPAVIVGGVAAAATTGALVAVGHRLGSVALPFTSIGAVLLHGSAGAPATYIVITGLLLHAAAIYLWSLICLQLARGFARRDIAAGLVAACQFTLSWIVAWLSGS